MARPRFLLVCAFILLASSFASAAVVERTFTVKNLTVTRLCNQRVITAVNNELPGPTLDVHEGDTVIVHVINESPYSLTVHWHGIFQKLSAWADGANMVTQCPILPGNKYTYKFKIIDQEGTLWWHAHSSWLRATVYGALIIRPKTGHSYPFPKPHKEVPIVLGEWWDANPVNVENQALATGAPPAISDAYTINGLPGDLYNCSQNQTYTLNVKKGNVYLLRIINAALNNQHFFKIANHNMTVVAVDASYTNPYITDVVVIAPGQTVDVLLSTDQPVGSYYMAATPYASASGAPPFDNTTTRGIVVYDGAASTATPKMPALPAFYDTPTAHKFYTSITGLVGGPHWVPVPTKVDKRMFVTIALGLEACPANTTCRQFIKGAKFSASMNNASFVLPTSLSMLQAFFFNVPCVYTTDFPSRPLLKFDYTNSIINLDDALLFAPKSTKVTKLKFNTTVELVFQDTALIGVVNHPMHIHGFNFHVLAQGFGNYDPSKHQKLFNLVNPQIRDTVAVPVGGWAVVRFTANNPGVWFTHCHLEGHLPVGLATAFVVENGPTPSTTLPPPPADLPQC